MAGERMAKRLLIITPVPERGAGCRYRIHQYLPFLTAEGIHATVRPFYSDQLFELVYAEGAYGRKALLGCQRALTRFAQLGSVGSFDGVFIYREALPIGPPVWEWCGARVFRKPIVFDFDDAIFLGDTNPINRMVHRMKCAWKVPHVLRWSRQVIAGNAYLAAYAQAYQPCVTIIPTPIDTSRYQPQPVSFGSDGVPVIGWIGTPTGVKYVESHAEAFRRLAGRRRFLLRVVGAGRPVRLPGVPLEERAWDGSREVEEFQRCDIGIYPLLDDAWSRGKCGFKALQFMACGVPVVASRVGMNGEIIAHGANGLLASSIPEWVEALEALLDDAALRRRLGDAARATVEERYSLAVNAPKFVRAVTRLWASGEGTA